MTPTADFSDQILPFMSVRQKALGHKKSVLEGS